LSHFSQLLSPLRIPAISRWLISGSDGVYDDDDGHPILLKQIEDSNENGPKKEHSRRARRKCSLKPSRRDR
jgi:hypothetical protein